MSRIAKLPAGYRQVEYIQSSGEQYIDTGFTPNQDTRVVMYFDLLAVNGQYAEPIFGVRTSLSSNGFYFWASGYGTTTEQYQSGYNTASHYVAVKRVGRHKVDKNKNVTTVDGISASGTYASFTAAWNLLLFNSYNNGALYSNTTCMKLYSCQIYDNGTLVRDYIPCINPSGEAGLYDLVYGVFYGNAGTGVFAVGRNVYSEDEITKLEYVESNGAQYVDTDFKPRYNSRVVADISDLANVSGFVFGTRNSASAGQFTAYRANETTFRSDYFATQQSTTLADSTARTTIDKNGNVLTAYGLTITNTAVSSGGCDYPLFLFALNNTGSPLVFASYKLYSCQIYDNGTLIREYHPATVNGEVGLWDCCSGVLYTSGSGTALIAGPEMETAPSTPSNLEILEHTDTSILLGWSEVANAFGYRVYKNGELYAEQTATEISDEVTPYQSVEYGVSAYNDKGESKTALLTVFISPNNPIPYLITDRAQTDADRLAALALMDYESMSDTERAEWNSDLKGAYNASDLNRVESAVAYLAEALRALPIELREYAKNLDVGWDKYFDVPYGSDAYSVITKENWTLKDVPTPADTERYLANVVKLRNALEFASDALPQTMNDLRWQGANAIESALKNLDAAIALFKENTQILIINTAAAWAFSGEVFMGEV